MPWNECKPMDERLRFVARLLEGEKMAPLCREFGISRVTGYKIFDRYKECGLDGLHDRSKAPYRQANKLPFQVERARDVRDLDGVVGMKLVPLEHRPLKNVEASRHDQTSGAPTLMPCFRQ